MKLLVSNVGSTSLKFKLFGFPSETVLAQAHVERVGSRNAAIYRYTNMVVGTQKRLEQLCVPDYRTGIAMFLADVTDASIGVLRGIEEIAGIGFKTVLAKGYYGVHLLTQDVLSAMEGSLFVAPGHNGPYLEAIHQFTAALPGVPLVGVFETAFHITIPLERRLYALPYEWYEQYGLMRLGYHGASHAYIAQEAARWPGQSCRIISCHLGGSSSICAIQDGKSVDNSFGYSLQTGLPHANRGGDADPYLFPILQNEGLSYAEISEGIGKRGGLAGISGVGGDLREITGAAKSGNARAQLAIRVYVSSIVRYIGAYYAELGGLDKLVFTGGIGENASEIRALVCGALRHMGVELDEAANATQTGDRCISAGPVSVLVIAANEELGVARQTYRCMQENRQWEA